MATTYADEVGQGKVSADGALDEKGHSQEAVQEMTYDRPKGLRGLYSHPRTQVSALAIFESNVLLTV